MAKLRCKCPGCRSVLQLEAERTHAIRVTCPQCRREFTVPAAATQPATAAGQASANWPTQESSLDDLFAHMPSTQISSGRAGGSGYASNSSYAPPQAPKKLSARAKKQIFTSVGIAVGLLAALGIGLVVAIPLLKRVNVAELITAPGGGGASLLSFDSREAVLRDLETECRRLEAIGRAIPKGDQSTQAAEPLMAGRTELLALLRRACRLSSVRSDLAEWAPGPDGTAAPPTASATQPAASPPSVAAGSANADTWFWQVKLGNSPDEAVTEAINEITLLRGSVFSVANAGILELPSPLDAKAEAFDWTDEHRRVLACIHLQGRLERDFARALAALEPDRVSAETLKPLHAIIDQYANEARELSVTLKELREKAGIKGNRMLVEYPKRTPYELQRRSMLAGLLHLESLYKSWQNEPQFEFVRRECNTLGEDIEEIMFGSSGKLLFASEQSSLERYQLLAAERQAQAKREAELAAKNAREMEEKLRLAEERRRQEELKRQEASAAQAASANNPPDQSPSAGTSAGAASGADSPPRPGGFAGPGGTRGPRRFGIPSLAGGGDGGSGSVDDPRPMAGRAFVGGPTSNAASGPPPAPSMVPPLPSNIPTDPQSTIVIKIHSQNNFDSNRIAKALAAKTGVKTYQSSQSNKTATMRFADKGDLKRFVDAIDFGTVESVDEPTRTISVTIP